MLYTSTASDGEFHAPAKSVITSFSGLYSYSHSDHHNNIAPHPEIISEVVPSKSKGEVNTTLNTLDWSREARRKRKLILQGTIVVKPLLKIISLFLMTLNTSLLGTKKFFLIARG